MTNFESENHKESEALPKIDKENRYIKRNSIEKVVQLKEPKFFYNYEKEDKFIERFYVMIIHFTFIAKKYFKEGKL